MPESSVKIKLGIELDKSELGQQIQEMQKELESYKLKIGVSTEQIDGESDDGGAKKPAPGTSFESGADEGIDFGPLSDLANEKFGEVTDGFSIVNDNLSGIFSEVKDIHNTLKGLFPQDSKAEKQDSGTPEQAADSGNKELNGIAEKILDQLIGLSDLVADIATTLENEKKPGDNLDGGKESKKDDKKDTSPGGQESNKQSSGEGSSSVIQDAIASFNQLIDSVGDPGAILEEIVNIATDAAESLLGETVKALSVLGEDIVKVVSDLLGDSLEGIQDEALKILETALQNIIASLLERFAKQGNGKDGGGKDDSGIENISSIISSVGSSVIGVLIRLQDALGDLLNPIISNLLPAILKQLEFDFFKSLIGGAVEKLGSSLIAQSAGGAAKLAEGVITGNIFRGKPSDGIETELLDSGDPAVAATMAFGEGFAANDPALIANEFAKIQKALEQSQTLIPETIDAGVDTGTETVKMTAVLEDIAFGITASNKLLTGIKAEVGMTDTGDNNQGVLVAELDQINTTIKQLLQLQGECTCQAAFDAVVAALGEIAGAIEYTNQLLGASTQDTLEGAAVDTENIAQSVTGEEINSNAPPIGEDLPSASKGSGVTDATFFDMPKLGLPAGIDEPVTQPLVEPGTPDIDLDTLFSNFAKIAEDVFKSIGVNLESVLNTGQFPTIGIDTENELGGQSQYDRTRNKVVLGEQTAKSLGSSDKIQKEDFTVVARELRAAIQLAFGTISMSRVAGKAQRGEPLPTSDKSVELPLLNLGSLADPSKGKDVIETVNDKTSLNQNPVLEKGARALNIDATVFAENLADVLFSGQPLADTDLGKARKKEQKPRQSTKKESTESPITQETQSVEPVIPHAIAEPILDTTKIEEISQGLSDSAPTNVVTAESSEIIGILNALSQTEDYAAKLLSKIVQGLSGGGAIVPYTPQEESTMTQGMMPMDTVDVASIVDTVIPLEEIAQPITELTGNEVQTGAIQPASTEQVDADSSEIIGILEALSKTSDYSAKLLNKIVIGLSTKGGAIVPFAPQEDSPLTSGMSAFDTIDVTPIIEVEVSQDEIAQPVEDIGGEQKEFNVELLFENFIRIAEKVFESIGVKLENIPEKLVPGVDVDADNRLGDIPSDYDPKKNRVLINEETSQRLGTSSGVNKDDFVLIARELRRAIQTAFGQTKDFKLTQRAAKGDVPFGGGTIPLSKIGGLTDSSKGYDILEGVNDRMRVNTNPPAQQKGVRALQVDADVFAQNLADTVFPVGSTDPSQGDLPKLDTLFRAQDDDDASFDELIDPLKQLVQGNEQLIVLSREAIQGERANLGRLSGDSLIDDSRIGSSSATTNLDKVSGKFKQVVDLFGGNLTSILKKVSTNIGAPDTRWVDKLNIISQGITNFSKLLDTVNPKLGAAFNTLVQAIGKDAANLLVSGVSALPELASQGAQMGSGLLDSAQALGGSLLSGDESGALATDLSSAFNVLKDRASEFVSPKIEQVKTTGDKIKSRVGQLKDPSELIDPRLYSFLETFAQKLNALGTSLLAGIGQLVVALKASAAKGETIPAAENFLSGVQQQLKTTSESVGLDTLFRPDPDNELSDEQPNINFASSIQKALPPGVDEAISDPWTTPGLPVSDLFPNLSQPIINTDEFPDPWAESSEQQKKKTSIPGAPENDGTPKGFNLANFLQKTLPVAIAGLVVAKLGTSLLNKIVPGKQNVEREINVNNLQSVLTKALVGAITLAIGQKLLPQLSGLFNPDKNVGMGDRIKSVFSNKANQQLNSQPLSGELAVATQGSVGTNGTDIFSGTSSFGDFLNSFGNNPPTGSTEELFRGVGAVNSERLDDKQSDLPKLIAVAIAGVLAKSVIGSFGKAAITGQPRQSSIPEKMFNGLTGLLSGGMQSRGRDIDKQIGRSPLNITRGDSLINNIFNGILNKSVIGQANKALGREPFGSKKGNNGRVDSITPGLFESLFSKLPTLFAALIIAALLSQFIPKLLAGLNKDVTQSTQVSQAESITDSIKKPIIDNSQVASKDDTDSLADLANKVVKAPVLANEVTAVAETFEKDTKPLIDNTAKQNIEQVIQPLEQSKQQGFIDMDALTTNFNDIAESVFASSGLNFDKIAGAQLLPTVSVDTKNKLEGSSAYNRKENKINLSTQVAQGLSSTGEIPREDFVTIAHELRHAIQLAFGRLNIPSAAKMAMEGKPLAVGDNQFQTQDDLFNQGKTSEVLSQVNASVNAVNAGDLTEGVRALELDAEVFAQNLADTVYGDLSFENQSLDDLLLRSNNPNAGNESGDLSSILDSGIDSIESLEKVFNEVAKNSKRTPLRDGQGVARRDANQSQDITVVAQEPNILETKPISNDPIDPTTLSLPDFAPDINIENIAPDIQGESDDINSVLKPQNFLIAIKAGIARIVPLLEQILAKVGMNNQDANMVDTKFDNLDTLFRGVPGEKPDKIDEQLEKVEPTGAVKIGDRIGNQLVAGIENVQGRINKRMQDAGMDDDEIRGLTDQAGAYMFANLSAFFPAGAIGLALAPVVASLSALGIPMAAAINQLAPIGQMLADTMRTMSPITTRFETIGGSEERGEEMLLFAEKVANDLNTPLLASIEGYSRLTAASKGSKLEGQDTEELFIGVSQAMAALGLNAQDASLIFLAFQQVISKGRVAAEELRGQIGERLPGAIQLAAEALGMTVADFSNSLDKGEISANVLLPKLAQSLQQEYGAGAEAASKGFLGTLNKIENSLFNIRRIMADEFGGIVAGMANVVATALDMITKFIDNILLKSGLLFNAILSIQAQIIAGTAFIFTKLNIPLALAKALSGSYAKLALVLVPFFIAMVREIMGQVIADAMGIEIANAIEMITGFFSQVVGRIIQTVIDLSKDPKQVLEGLVNLARSIGQGVITASTAFLNMASAIRENFGAATDSLGFFIQKLGQAERLINKIADSGIAKIYAPQPEMPEGQTNPERERGMFGGMFNGQAIARSSLEFFGLYMILIQTMILLRMLGEHIGSIGLAFKEFGGKFSKAMLSMKMGKSVLTMLTLGFSGFNLVLAGLFTLIALMAFKSDSVNTFLSELSNSVKDLEKLNTNLDTLTNRKIDITTRITQLDEEGYRDTPFQDKGLTLSFWRAKDQEQFTTDDVIRRIQRQIDSNAYRRDLPILPQNYNQGQGSMVDPDNINSLGRNLVSRAGRENTPENFTEIIEFRQNLIRERSLLEEDLTLRLGLDATNIYDELNRLQGELNGVDTTIGKARSRKESLEGRGNIFGVATSENPAIELVKVFRDFTAATGDRTPANLVPNLLLGAENIDATEQEILLTRRKEVLEKEIASYQRQLESAPGSTIIVEENSVEAYVSQLEESLKRVNNELNVERTRTVSRISAPTMATAVTGGGVDSINELARLNRIESLERQQKSLGETIALTQQHIWGLNREYDNEIKARQDLIKELENPANNVGKTGREQNQQEIANLRTEIETLTIQSQAAMAEPARREIDRINQDLMALEIFADMPGVFNNAFNQDDTVLRDIVTQQLSVFPMVQDERINPQRLDDGNVVQVLPRLIEDVESRRENLLGRKQVLQNEIDLLANPDNNLGRRRELERELAQLDASGTRSREQRERLQEQLNNLPNQSTDRQAELERELAQITANQSVTTQQRQSVEQELAQLPTTEPSTRRQGLEGELARLEVTSNAATQQRQQIESELAQLTLPDSTTARRDELTQQLSQLDLSSNATIQQRESIQLELAQLPEISSARPDLERELAQLDLSRDAADTRRGEIESELTGLTVPDTSRRVAIKQELAAIAAELAANQRQGETPRASEELQSTINSLVRVLQTSDVGSLASIRFQASPIMQNLPALEANITTQLAESQTRLDTARNARAEVADTQFFETPYDAEAAGLLNQEDIKRLNNLLRVEIKSRDDVEWLTKERERILAEADRVDSTGGDSSELRGNAQALLLSAALNQVDVEPQRTEILTEAGARAGLPAYQFDRNLREELIAAEDQVISIEGYNVADLNNQLALIERANQLMLTGQAQVTGIDPELNELLKQRKIALENELSLLQSTSDVTSTRKQELEKELEQIALSSAAIARRRQSVLDTLEQSPSIPGVSRRNELEKTLAALTSQIDSNSQNRQQIEQELAQLPAVDTDREVRKRELEQQLSQTDLITQRTDTERKQLEKELADLIAGDDTANRRQQLESDLAKILQTQDSANRQRRSVEQELAQLPVAQARTPQQMQVEVELAELDIALQQTNARRGELQAELDNLDLTSGNAQERLGQLNQELKALDKELLGLKGLDIFLGIAQSYSDLGAGKQALDERKVTRALAALSAQLGDSPVQSEAISQFRETPTLPNLAQLEQSILIQLPTARQGVTRAQSERENVLNTPFLRTERDFRGAGLVSRDQKAELDLLSAQEKRLSDAIADTRSEVTKAYQEYNQSLTDGLDFQPALDGYRAVRDELKVLTKQLQDLRNERNKVLDEVKELAPPIQVDATARQQRLDSVDGAIADAEGRVNELLKQFQLIQDTKLALGGTGQIGEGLEQAADELRKPLKGFAAFRENFANATWLSSLALPSREKRAQTMESRAAQLNPALGNLSRFVAQQENLSSGARQGLTGALNSGNFSLTQQALESIDIEDGKIYFGGQELDGTPEEVKAFTEALKTATKVLNLIGDDSNNGSRPVQEALAEGLGIQTKTTEREAITASYQQQIANLATKGVFTESQLTALTQGGIKVEEAQAILDTVRNQDGLSNWQSTMERLQAQGVSEGDRRDILADIEKLDQVFVDALALDLKGATKPILPTVGEEEYTQTVGKLFEIGKLTQTAFDSMALQYYDGDLGAYEAAIKDVKPGLMDNIEQLRKLESELDFLGGQRMLLAEELKRPDLTKEERRQIEKDSTRLDTEFKNKYREKAVAGQELTESKKIVEGVKIRIDLLAKEIEASDLSKGLKDSILAQLSIDQKQNNIAIDALSKYEDLMAESGEEALEAANKAITRAMENFEKIVVIIEATTTQKLTDITKALREFSSNTKLAATDFSQAVAGLPGDPVRLNAEKELAVAEVNEEQSRQKVAAAQLAKDDADKEVERVERRTAFDSPQDALEAVEVVKEKQREQDTKLAEAEQEYFANISARTDAQLALLNVEASAPLRIAQLNTKGISNARKQQQIDGGLTKEQVERLRLDDEIALIDIELGTTETQLASISKALQEGIIQDVPKANARIEELVNSQQDLISNRLDKILEKENLQREKSIKLLENQASLSSKYFDRAITGYEALNKATERYSRQLDSLTKVGDEIKNLTQAEFQVKIGRSEDRLSIADTARGIQDTLATGELSPQQQAFQQRRLRGIQQFGNQNYGMNANAFSSNEDTALAAQQKIATQMAKDKMEALEKEQAIAAKLLAIEIKRNDIAAEMAVKEAEIGKLRAEQAAIQAQLALRQAVIQTANSEDKTPVLLAELELAIANSQLELAGEEVGVANQNKALQSLFADLQKQAFEATSEASRDDLIMETLSNENVDVSKLIVALNNFKDFDPNSVSAREVFEPYLDWIKSQTPQRDPNTPIGLPLEAFKGDIQAWMDANVAIAKEQQAKAAEQTPKAVQGLNDLFNSVFGSGIGSQVVGSIDSGTARDINKELSALAGSRMGAALGPTKERIESAAGKAEINDALSQGRRLAMATEPIDDSRLAIDVYAVKTGLDDSIPKFYAMAASMADTASGIMAVQRLLGKIEANTSLGTTQSSPETMALVEELMTKIDIASGFRDILTPIVGEGESSAITPVSAEEFEALMDQTNYFPEIPTVPEWTVGNEATFEPTEFLDVPEFSDELQIPSANPLTKELDDILDPQLPGIPALPPEFSSSANPVERDVNQVASNIFNPTIQNRVTPSYTPAINVAAQRRDPGYFYNNLASQIKPQIDYRVPVGVQQADQEMASSSTRPGNTTINITNKIDANSQREMYQKIGQIQTESIISALSNMA
jgi:tape measure domain-containing protein